MKKFIVLIVLGIMLFVAQPVFAANQDATISTEYFSNGCYTVTVIEDLDCSEVNSFQPMSQKTETKTKTKYFYNASDEVMWYVRVVGTFTYGDGTSKCISATPSAESKNSFWKVFDITGGKSGNQAYATATGKRYLNGIVVESKTETVTLTCSPTGVFS